MDDFASQLQSHRRRIVLPSEVVDTSVKPPTSTTTPINNDAPPPPVESSQTPTMLHTLASLNESRHIVVPRLPLTPTFESIVHSYGSTSIGWQFSTKTPSKGLVLLFHGCGGSSELWFELPEHRANVRSFLKDGFDVMALSSRQRLTHKCWDDTFTPEEGGRPNQDIMNVLETLSIWLKRENKYGLPFFAFGASSGGTFVTILSRTMFLHGTIVMISPGSERALLQLPTHQGTKERYDMYRRVGDINLAPILDPTRFMKVETLFNLPPIGFMFMTRDQNWATKYACEYHRKAILENNPWLNRTSSSEADDRVPLWPVEPKSWTSTTLIDMVDEFLQAGKSGEICSAAYLYAGQQSNRQRRTAFEPPSDSRMRTSAAAPADGDLVVFDAHGFVTRDPRRTPLARHVRQVLESMDPNGVDAPIALGPFSSVTDADGARRLVWQECIALIDQNESGIDELFNSHYAIHEMTSAYTREQVEWFKRRIEERDP